MDIKELWAKVREIFEPLVNEQPQEQGQENRASYPWSKCIADQTAAYGSKATAEKVCGAIKSKYGGRADTEDIFLPDGFDLMGALADIEKEYGLSSDLTPEETQKVDEMLAAINAGTMPMPMIEDQAHEYHSAKMEKCLMHLKDQGADPGKAHAICYASLGAEANRSIGMGYMGIDFEPDEIASIMNAIEAGNETLSEDRIKNAIEHAKAKVNRSVILPTQTRALTVTRTADGKLRWLMIAASAVVNRVGAIDSTTLFDNFIKHSKETGQYPRLDFLHEESKLTFGVADWLKRDGALYLASGTFDDTDLARAAAQGIEKEPGYWGASIAYRVKSDPMVILADGQIPVYTDGLNNFISIVPRDRAANLFTTIGVTQEGNKRMDKATYDELVRLVGEEKARPFASEVDDANRTITETGMIVRADSAPTTQTKTVTTTTKVEPPVTDVTVATSGVVPPTLPTDAQPTEARQDLATVEEQIAALTDRVTKLEMMYAGQTQVQETAEKRAVDTMTAIDTRLANVEKNSQAWADWLAGLPEQRRSDATYRPRDNGGNGAPMTSDQVVASTMEKINARHRR